MEWSTETLEATLRELLTQLLSLELYVQIAVVGAALLLAGLVAGQITRRARIFSHEPEPGDFFEARSTIYRGRRLLVPIMSAVVLGAATAISDTYLGESWLVRGAQGVAFVYLAYRIAGHFIENATIKLFLRWICVPLAILYILGWLGPVIEHLDSVIFEIGNIKVSLYAILRTIVFGAVLFWLGRLSNATGQRVIRSQEAIDAGTREVVAKLFEIGVFIVIFVLLLNIMGIDLTALAVFSGALGVGLGFGLQQIASNFISGLIILLDRTITIGDYIELEDGRAGNLRELTMRSATLETFDGKDIMVPNERFITTAFVNWTHNNKKQRYPLNFQVAYGTDLEKLFEIVRETVRSHPKVLSGEEYTIGEQPDAEIESFADSGINILVEFWMEGIDDGDNRVGADLLLMIWMALKQHDIEIPFPQREVRLLGEKEAG